ncbi:hypothetical protein clem_14320 [Legionella clemsonensis]|uniref:Uncharacterized protein n=1 Tax=Legionella clemsonensis TaxID=1867846 RepID=A0A222P6A3_9GAMM|nr:hypothetical protein clem_14320 [Legionella clemsonensis]
MAIGAKRELDLKLSLFDHDAFILLSMCSRILIWVIN